jgi:hypothetical protein
MQPNPRICVHKPPVCVRALGRYVSEDKIWSASHPVGRTQIQIPILDLHVRYTRKPISPAQIMLKINSFQRTAATEEDRDNFSIGVFRIAVPISAVSK